MTLDDFLVRLGTALVCGTVIGIERQFYQRTGGLRTYALVSVGAALFVFVGVQAGDNGISRIVGQVVTGIGFLGAGIILHSGFNVRGLNGAAAIWCASAVGSLAGAGYLLEAAVGTAAILGINTLYRPLVAFINRQPSDPQERGIRYAIRLTVPKAQEAHVRSLVVQLTAISPLLLHELHSTRHGDGGSEADPQVDLKALLTSEESHDMQVEQLVGRLSGEPCVVGVSWHKLPDGKIE